MNKISLPQLLEVKLKNFSLFSLNPNAEIIVDKPVACFVGANGVGKSTLLAAINYGFTGRVPDPGKKFKSIDEYYSSSERYTTKYFRGRVDGSDIEHAEISLRFKLGSFEYEICRGLFEPNELRGMSIKNYADGAIIFDSNQLQQGERNRAYQDNFKKHSHVNSFEEFVFLQHFVLSFDERRKTLLWDQGIMELVLLRVFGVDPSMVINADNYRRAIDRFSSRVRNAQWDITQLERHIKDITASESNKSSIEASREKHEQLLEEQNKLFEEYNLKREELLLIEQSIKDENICLANDTLSELTLRDQYENLFSDVIDGGQPVDHILIINSLGENKCGVCNSISASAIDCIKNKLEKHVCPLCESKIIPANDGSENLEVLKKLDSELAESRKKIKGILLNLQGYKLDEGKAKEDLDLCKAKLDQFNDKNKTLLDGLNSLLTTQENAGNPSLSAYRAQLQHLLEEKNNAHKEQIKNEGSLKELQRSLEDSFAKIESQFVDIFTQYANQFIGMPISVQLEVPGGAVGAAKLVVSVKGLTRREQHQLSESQKFFLDIAFRMALISYMAEKSSQGGMYIDTPEGSLDIAYEKRAGDMLAMFANQGHQIVMSANLNSSQLLLAIAKKCRSNNLRISRVMDWAELSQVQQEEEKLFEEAYQKIEQEMLVGTS